MLVDQTMVVSIKGKGLVAMTVCGHAGVVNICRYVRRLPRGEEKPVWVLTNGRLATV